MALIRLNRYKIVDSSEIQEASRCGNLTDVYLKSRNGSINLMQLPDENYLIWNAIQECSKGWKEK